MVASAVTTLLPPSATLRFVLLSGPDAYPNHDVDATGFAKSDSRRCRPLSPCHQISFRLCA